MGHAAFATIIYYGGTGEFSRPFMRVLYVIFVLSVGALLWAAFAATRHIRRLEQTGARASEREPRPGSDIGKATDDPETTLSADHLKRD